MHTDRGEMNRRQFNRMQRLELGDDGTSQKDQKKKAGLSEQGQPQSCFAIRRSCQIKSCFLGKA